MRSAGGDTLDWSAEARKQAILADGLVVTKTDIAGAEPTKALIAQLAALNPRAAIEIAVDGELDPQRLIEPATWRSEAVSSPRPPTATASSASC